jgi:hypothetical protein
MMQAGQEYARRQEEREQLKLDLRSAAVGATATSPPPQVKKGVVVEQGKKDL